MKLIQPLYKSLPLFIVALLLAAGLGLASPAAAQQPTPTPPANFTAPGIEISAYPAFDGYFKYGEWLPIWVEVSNSGADLNAEVRVQVSGANVMVFTTPVELPSGARKRLAVYVLPNNFSRQLIVQLVSEETALASRRVDVNPQATITYLAGLVAPERGALTAIDDIDIPGARRPIEIVDVPLNDLPERYESLRSFDLLVITNTDTSSLSPDQARALESWVRQGGRLVLGSGANVESLAAGLSETLLPVSNWTTTTIDDLPGLETYVGPDDDGDLRPVRVPGPFVAAAGDAQGGQVVASEGELPLVIEWALDSGWVDLIALDLSGSPFDAWNGATPFWARLVSATAIYPEYAPPDMSSRQQFASGMTYPLSNLPMLDLPSVKGLAALLGLYILLVGPVNYLLLRRQNRLHLAWLTIPIITVVFSAAAFGIGYALHGTDVFVNKLAVIQLEPSGRARVDSFVGLFSPAQSAYEVQIHNGGLVSPLTPYYDPWSSAAPAGMPGEGRRITLVQGNPAYVRGLSVEQWSMQSFMSEGTIIDFGQIEADLRLEDNHIVGQIRNHTTETLTDAALIYGTRFVKLGELPAGGSMDVTLDLVTPSTQTFGPAISYVLFEDELSGQNGPPPRHIEVRRAIIESLFERTPPYISAKRAPGGGASSTLNQSPVLIGWLDQAPPQITVSNSDPAQQTTAVVVLPLTYTLPEEGTISLPPGLVPGKLIETPREGGTCGMPGTMAVYIVRGDAVFEFSLPASLDPQQVQNFKLNLNSDAGFFSPPDVAIYDWSDEAWLTLEGVTQGLNLVPASPNLVSVDGKVQIRMSGENLQYCYYLDFGVEGVR